MSQGGQVAPQLGYSSRWQDRLWGNMWGQEGTVMAGEMENEDSSWDSQLPWFSLPVSRLNSELPPFLHPHSDLPIWLCQGDSGRF